MSESASGAPVDTSAPPPPGAQSGAGVGTEALQRAVAERDAARARVDELARALLAAERDREAFKARLQREREQLLELERGQVALALVEAVDELDRCLQAADESPLAQGVRLIRADLLRRLEGSGVSREELAGQPFDPARAEAAGLEVTGVPGEDGKVLAVLKACYALRGRVLRPGQVTVARYVKPADA